MQLLQLIAAVAVNLLVGLASAYAADLLNNPDASTIYLLQCKSSHTTPSFDAMAMADDSVNRADEFHRQDAMRSAKKSLQTRAAALEGVNRIIVNLGSHFSEYDMQYNEYTFELNDSSFIPYSAFGHSIRLVLTNGTKAQTWKLAAKDGEDVLRKNRGDRSASLMLTLELQESPPVAGGDAAILNAKIIGYDVLSHFGNIKLGSVSVGAAQ